MPTPANGGVYVAPNPVLRTCKFCDAEVDRNFFIARLGACLQCSDFLSQILIWGRSRIVKVLTRTCSSNPNRIANPYGPEDIP